MPTPHCRTRTTALGLKCCLSASSAHPSFITICIRVIPTVAHIPSDLRVVVDTSPVSFPAIGHSLPHPMSHPATNLPSHPIPTTTTVSHNPIHSPGALPNSRNPPKTPSAQSHTSDLRYPLSNLQTRDTKIEGETVSEQQPRRSTPGLS